jgi:hypothetical protein
VKKIKKWISIDLVRKIQLLIIWDKIKNYFVVPILLILAYLIYSINNEYMFLSSSYIKFFTDPFLSTLIAAIFGGALAFYGSVYVQKSELRSKSSIRRRDEIYIPLYNELLNMESNLIEYPCPSGFKLLENMGYHNDPIFLVWNKFKKDYRKFLVPTILNRVLEEFILLTNEYTKFYNEASQDPEVQLLIKEIIISNSVQDNSHRRDLTHHYLPCNKNLSLIIKRLNSDLSKVENNRQIPVKTDEEIKMIAHLILIECSKINSVKELQKIRNSVDYKIQELVSVLEIIINYINEKYDQKTKLF